MAIRRKSLDSYAGLRDMAARDDSVLARYVTGSASAMGQRNDIDLDNKYIVLDTSGMPDDLLLPGIFWATDVANDLIMDAGGDLSALIADELWSLVGANSNPLAAGFVQELVVDAARQVGVLGALADSNMAPEKLQRTLEQTSGQFERSTLEVRKLCERHSPEVGGYGSRPVLPRMETAGFVERFGYGWLHIQLNTLLPHCRYQTSDWLSDTIRRLLDEYEAGGSELPFFKEAMLVIDEHCGIKGRHIFDQDNKGWKAVSNAIKGRLIPDDDQHTLALALLSTPVEQDNLLSMGLIQFHEKSGAFTLTRKGRSVLQRILFLPDLTRSYHKDAVDRRLRLTNLALTAYKGDVNIFTTAPEELSNSPTLFLSAITRGRGANPWGSTRVAAIAHLGDMFCAAWTPPSGPPMNEA